MFNINDYFTIGETAKINNVSIQALRLYDEMGLLKPAYLNPQTGYRYYALEQFFYLDIIKIVKHFKIPLKEIKPAFDSNDIGFLLEFLVKQIDVIENELNYIKKMRKDIDLMIELMEYGIKNSSKEDLFFKEISTRKIVRFDLDAKDMVEDFEIQSRELVNMLEEEIIDFTYESGYFIDTDILKINQDILYKGAYITVGDYIKDYGTSKIAYITGGKYLCLIYNKLNKKTQIVKLNKYMKDNNLLPKLAVEVELYDKINDWSNELQILVK